MTLLKEENRYDDDNDDDAFNKNWLFYLQVIKILLLIVVLFLCYDPRLVMMVKIMVMIKIGLSQRDFTDSVYTARISFYLLSLIHSALNPFVYSFMSSNFRKMVLNSCSSCGLTFQLIIFHVDEL